MSARTAAPDIRRATVDDAEAIARVNVAAGRAGWTTFLGAERLEALEPPTERWREMIAAAHPVFVAVADEEVVGFASVRLVPDAADTDTGELTTLYTDPSVWGGGVGRALLACALEELRRGGCREAVLWTEERNERPRRIYRQAGWVLDGGRREREYLGATIREVRYRIELRPPEAGAA